MNDFDEVGPVVTASNIRTCLYCAAQFRVSWEDHTSARSADPFRWGNLQFFGKHYTYCICRRCHVVHGCTKTWRPFAPEQPISARYYPEGQWEPYTVWRQRVFDLLPGVVPEDWDEYLRDAWCDRKLPEHTANCLKPKNRCRGFGGAELPCR